MYIYELNDHKMALLPHLNHTPTATLRDRNPILLILTLCGVYVALCI